MIQISMGPDDLPKSPAGNPELPTKNRHFGTSKQGRKYITERGKKFRDALARSTGAAIIAEGTWELNLKVTTARRGGKLPDIEDEAGCDSDACLAPVRDALEAVGIVDNDARIVRNICSAEYTGTAGLFITLNRIG